MAAWSTSERSSLRWSSSRRPGRSTRRRRLDPARRRQPGRPVRRLRHHVRSHGFRQRSNHHLTGAPLELTNTALSTSITGPAAGVTVSGAKKSGVFQIESGVTATLSGLTITGGSAYDGAGVYAATGATISLADCVITGNTATHTGGGLESYGTATLTGCTITGNSAATSGGGLQNTGLLMALSPTARLPRTYPTTAAGSTTTAR